MASRAAKRNWLAYLLAIVLALSIGAVPLAPPAGANHMDPTTCLDLEPETDRNPTGTTHTVSATLRVGSTSDPLNPTCAGERAATDHSVLINFEIEGPNDPDRSENNPNGVFSPESPDRQCLIQIGRTSCDMPPYPEGGAKNLGTDTITGWIAGSTVDEEESRDADTRGSNPDNLLGNEPNKTDVVEKTWVPGRPSRLDCDDESGDDRENNPSSDDGATADETTETYTCRVTDEQGHPTGDRNSVDTNTGTSERVFIRGENESPSVNDPDDGASHDSPDYGCRPGLNSGQCTVDVPQSEGQEGSATICFWVDQVESENSGKSLCASEGVDDPEGDDLADKVVKRWISRAGRSGTAVDAEPENDTNEVGQTHRITATVYDEFREPHTGNTTVNFEFFQGSPGDVDGDSGGTPDRTCSTRRTVNGQQTDTSSCFIEYTAFRLGRDLVCVWVGSSPPSTTGNNTNGTCDGETREQEHDAPNQADAPQEFDDRVDVVEKTWVAAPNPTTASRLDCTPETDSNPTGTSHTITCTASNNQGTRIGGAGIDAEATGANDPDVGDTRTTPDFSCTTSSTDDSSTAQNELGTCSFTHGPQGRGTTGDPGTTTYRVWIDTDGSNNTSEADPTEGRDETTTPGQTAETDGTDVVEKTWVFDPGTLTMTPESDRARVGECNPFTIAVRDSQGRGISGLTIDVEQRHALANDSTANNEPDVGFCVPTSGPNRSGVDESRGDLHSPQENPDNRGTAGGETIAATDANGEVTIGINVTPAQGSDGTGNVTVTAFSDASPENDDPDVGEAQDTSTKTWTNDAPARTIDCEPETATTTTGDTHTVSCVVRDSSGQPVAGEEVTFTESGPGNIEGGAQRTTSSNGTVTVQVTSTETGQQTITGTISESSQGEPDTDECERAANDPSGSPQGTCSDSVTNTWVSGGRCPNHESDDRNHIVGTEGDDTLVGTGGGDVICGLGGNDVLAGAGGDDLLLGGGGNDWLRGEDGDDTLHGGGGKDELRGGNGNDTLRGGAQNDDLRGNAGDDRMFGGNGFDVIRGGNGHDEGYGGSGNDTLQGFTGRDKLVGNAGNDTIRGGGGADDLRGGKNDDVISGGKGPDRIRGGPGRDVCAGGAGNNNIAGCEA